MCVPANVLGRAAGLTDNPVRIAIYGQGKTSRKVGAKGKEWFGAMWHNGLRATSVTLRASGSVASSSSSSSSLLIFTSRREKL